MSRPAVTTFVQTKPPEIFKLNDFAGGLNDRDPEVSLADNESPSLQNVIFGGRGSIKKRLGTNRFGNDFGNNKIVGLSSFYYGSGTKKMVSVAGTDAYVEVSGTWTAQSQTLTSAATAFFDQFLDSGSNETLILVNGNETKDYTGSAWADLGGTPPAGTKYIKSFKDRLYLANNAATPNRVWYSAVGNSESWNTGAGGDWFNVPALKDGDDITGLGVQAGAGGTSLLVIFKRYSIWSWDTFQLRLIAENVGCVAPRTIINANNVLVFLSYTDKPKLYYLSGGQLVYISDKVSGTMGGISTGQITNAAGVFFNNRYYLSYAASGSSNNDTILVYDFNLNAFTKYTGINANVFAVFRSSNDEELYYGEATADSLVIKMETGTSDWNESAETQTTAINAFYETKFFDFGLNVEKKRFQKLYTTFLTQSSASKLHIRFNIDYNNLTGEDNIEMSDQDAVYGTAIYGIAKYGGREAKIEDTPIKSKGRFIQIRCMNSSAAQPFEVLALALTYVNLPLR